MAQERVVSRNLSFGKLAAFCMAFYLVMVLAMVVRIGQETGGHFTYALDDPYIHLALAENLARGHYGLNMGDFSSPSSSILWPFLLVPFAGTALHPYLPLIWNLLFGSLAAVLIAWLIDRYPPQRDEHGQMPWWKQAITGVFLILAANLPSLTLVGMEHILQVLLAICCAIGVMEALQGRAIPAWCLAAAVLSPLVRYEGLGLTAAVCIALWGQRQSRKAFAVLGLSLAPLAAFSIFLHHVGLPFLPMSVLLKGNMYQDPNVVRRAYHLAREGMLAAVLEPIRYSMVVLLLTFAGLAAKAQTRERRIIFGGVAFFAAAHLLVGRFGWFYRYEDYALIFLTLIAIEVLSEGRAFLFGFYVLGLMCIASPYIIAIRRTPTAASEVYYQQYQMHRFVKDFYHGNFAVNDIGWTSYQHDPSVYVLDVYGLASPEASRQQNKSAAWMDGVVERHDVNLAMIYPNWFDHIPGDWLAEASLCMPHPPTVVGGRCVVFYSTRRTADATIRADLQRFASTVPAESGFAMAKGDKNTIGTQQLGLGMVSPDAGSPQGGP